MKGQIDLEFMVSLVVFIMAVAYIHVSLSSMIPEHSRMIKRENLYAKAYALSQFLINDPGNPANWTTLETAKRIGLMDERYNKTNLISMTKATNFCKSYETFLRKTGINNTVKISIIDLENVSKLTSLCSPNYNISTPVEVTLRRIVAYEYDGELRYAEFTVTLWER
ncbi:MAG: hypothetical protein J7K98_03560 [Candidatus Aenigmarchaeota archaeon]|nr:hypothetical protein [Candidatus Aenigmarchaeota archaeon]